MPLWWSTLRISGRGPQNIEKAAGFVRKKRLTKDQEWAHSIALDAVIEVNESDDKLVFDGLELPHMDALTMEDNAVGRSEAVADYMYQWWREDWAVEEGIEPYDKISHKPVGPLVQEHFANVFVDRDGVRSVVDFSFAAIDPNSQWPYVGTEEDWRAEVDKASVLGRPEREPEPIDPRTLTLPKVTPGEYNPLIERARVEKGRTRGDQTEVRFLMIDSVKVACAKYVVNKAGEPSLHSIETREEYRHQGYMKKLLQELSQEYGGRQVRSSGSMTTDGYEYTRHLTVPREGAEQKINWDHGLNGKPKFGFVANWIEGYTR